MNARNLGVVFGRKSNHDYLCLSIECVADFDITATLMWSPAPGAEFSDMAGKALLIEWFVENAPFIFHRNNTN